MEARIDNFQTWVKGADGEQLKQFTEQLIQDSGFTILNFIEHHFEPQGYTALWLLAESHCALHTFPEENKSYLELSSCNLQMYEDFVKLVDKFFDKPEN